jgi:hypothetical protein
MIGLSLFLGAALLLVGAPATPPATPPTEVAAVPAAPTTRILARTVAGDHTMTLRIEPGVPKAGAKTRVIIEISRPGAAGPIPVSGATLSAEISPDRKATTDRKMRRALARVKGLGRAVHRLHDRGTYGFQVTLPASGSYAVVLSGTLGDQPVDATFGLHADIWPAPDLQTEAVAAPSGRSRRPLRRQ